MQTRGTSSRALGSVTRSDSLAGGGAEEPTTDFSDTFAGAAGLLSAHTSDSGHTYANQADFGAAAGLAHFALNGTGSLTSDGAEGTAAVQGLAMAESNNTTLLLNFPAYSNKWLDLYLNTTVDPAYRIYFDIVFSDADTLEIGGMVVGNGSGVANSFGAPWHVDATFGVDMEFRFEVRPTSVALLVNGVSIGSMTFADGSVSADGTLILDGDIQSDILIRSIDVEESVAAPAVWNPADKTPSVTLSNANLTAAGGDDGGSHGVRATRTRSTGKYAFAVHLDANPNPPDWEMFAVGFSTLGWGINTNWLGDDGASFGLSTGGWAWTLGALGATLVEFAAGDTVTTYVDLDARKIWFAINGVTYGDPVAGTGEALSYPGALTLAPTLQLEGSGVIATSIAPTGLAAGFLPWEST